MSYLLRLADSLVLPYDVQRYGERLNRDALEFQVKLKMETKRKDIEKLAGIYYWTPVLQGSCKITVVCFYVGPSVSSVFFSGMGH